jgi:molecular chaperone GrpE
MDEDKKEKKDSQKKKIKELEKKLEENFAGWQRARADYENLQKESQKKQLECKKSVKKDLIQSLLPVLNSFNQAFRSVPENIKDEAWIKGFEYIKKQFEDILKEWGIEPIKTIGEKFNPKLHEATGQEESEEKSGIIIKEVMPGYKLNGETIVFAKVIVAK